MDDGTTMRVVFLWLVPYPDGVPWWHQPPDTVRLRREWCRDALGPGNDGRTWLITTTHAMFANREDAMMFDLAWS